MPTNTEDLLSIKNKFTLYKIVHKEAYSVCNKLRELFAKTCPMQKRYQNVAKRKGKHNSKAIPGTPFKETQTSATVKNNEIVEQKVGNTA